MFEADGNKDKVKLILTLLLTSRGIPQLLYGTEIGMRGGQSHVELRADFPGGFPNHDRSAFTAAGRTALENEMHSHVKNLLRLRKTRPALSQGKMIHYAPTWNNDVYRILRVHDEGTVLIVANGHDEQRTVELSDLSHRLATKLRDLLTGEVVEVQSGVVLSPFASRVFQTVRNLPLRALGFGTL
jgi:glycosidase